VCLRLDFNIYSFPVHELLSLSPRQSLISSSDWYALNCNSVFSLSTSSNSIGKSILHAPLTSLVWALNSHTNTTRLRFWGSGSLGGVKMMPLCHGWGWKPLQTVSPIHLRHSQSVWAHWYAIHRHIVAALHSHTHTTWLRFWALGHLQSWNVVITSWLRLTATSNCSLHP